MKSTNFLFYLALLLVILVLSDLFLWFTVAAKTINIETARRDYLSYYPPALQNSRVLTVISLLILSFSGYIFLNTQKENKNRITGIILGLLATLLLMAKIYSFTKYS